MVDAELSVKIIVVIVTMIMSVIYITVIENRVLHSLFLGLVVSTVNALYLNFCTMSLNVVMISIALGCIVVISYYDLIYLYIPALPLSVIFICGIVNGVLCNDWEYRVIGSIVFSIPLLIAWVYSKVNGLNIIGDRDIFLISMYSWIFSYPISLIGFIFGNLLTAIISRVFRNRIEIIYMNKVPYGLFMSIGYIVAVFVSLVG